MGTMQIRVSGDPDAVRVCLDRTLLRVLACM